MQNAWQHGRIKAKFGDQQGFHLRIAILLNHVNVRMLCDKFAYRIGKRISPQTQAIQMHANRLHLVQRFTQRRTSRAKIDHANRGFLRRHAQYGLRYQRFGAIKFSQ